MKRSLSITPSMDDETRQFPTSREGEKSVTCIEDLSSELFYEIFDYLDGCEIFDAFSNLNIRFKQLFHSTSCPLKIHRFSTRERTFRRYCKQVIIPNKHQIVSLNLFDQTLINLFCTLCNIDWTFNRLESLVLHGIKSNQLLPLLINAKNSPRLLSLSIFLMAPCADLGPIYKLIFNLPTLKNLKFSLAMRYGSISLPFVTDKQISPIERLNINYECTSVELDAILSCTPYLRRLTCLKLFNPMSPFAFTLSNLRYISIRHCDFSFDQFEIFIKQICSKLQVLRLINRSNDLAYLNADRWERLISQYIPDLYTFQFHFFENLFLDHSFSSYHTRINQFTTSFWIKHQWILELEINIHQIVYSIHSHRKRWYHSPEIIPDFREAKNSSTELVMTGFLEKENQIIHDRIKQLSSWIRITHLNIDCSTVPIAILIKLTHLLSYVHSLQVIPTSVPVIHRLLETHIEATQNHITKVNIGLVTDIIQVTYLLDFFPHLKYLEMNCGNDLNLELLLESITMKIANCITPQLGSLCLFLGQINNEIIGKLYQLMILKKFLRDCTIKRL